MYPVGPCPSSTKDDRGGSQPVLIHIAVRIVVIALTILVALALVFQCSTARHSPLGSSCSAATCVAGAAPLP